MNAQYISKNDVILTALALIDRSNSRWAKWFANCYNDRPIAISPGQHRRIRETWPEWSSALRERCWDVSYDDSSSTTFFLPFISHFLGRTTLSPLTLVGNVTASVISTEEKWQIICLSIAFSSLTRYENTLWHIVSVIVTYVLHRNIRSACPPCFLCVHATKIHFGI